MLKPATRGFVDQSPRLEQRRVVLIGVEGGGRASNVRWTSSVSARFCQIRVSLLAPEPQGGASRCNGVPSIAAMAGCLSVPGTFSRMYPTPAGCVS